MIEFTLNGENVATDADPATPLVYVLRNRFDLKSMKIGCEAEQCGTCRVLIEGTPAHSCTTTLEDARGKSVTTLEGIADSTALSAVQSALLRHNATQCGYCLSGIVMTAHALFAREPRPSRESIVEALEPHLCRCGAQPRVLRALQELADGG